MAFVRHPQGEVLADLQGIAVVVDAKDLADAITATAQAVRLEVAPAGHQPVALRWGGQIDTRVISTGAGRDATAGDAHPEQVAAYLAKYLTKSTEDFGLDGQGKVHSAVDARYLGASRHAVRIIETAERLAADAGEDYQRLADRYGTLGYGGHVLTKTRRYSTTFGALRQARREWHRRPRKSGLDPDADVRELDADDDPTATPPPSWSNATGATSARASSTPRPQPGR